ncbi:MAG TPA: isoleucine--tRNA ligase [Acidimicrobiia bacterium]|nr:isoleucine--tRNA ligase [Acidimicrobiia bacterium]
MPFRAVGRDLDLVALERRVLTRWAEDDVFAESLRRRVGAREWVFYEGPPTANGQPGLHHVWARSFKDLYPRFHTMRGRYVARKGGWDCHGLPVELEVEKELGFSGKLQIEEYGIAAFNERCRESVHRYVEDWSALTSRIGMWIDTADAYWTLSNAYIESVWWHLKTMWERDLVYEGFKVVPYCGRCGTALSSHEVAQGYGDVTEPSVFVRFPVDGHDFDLLVWTTTPWTLLSNVAVAVGPEVVYARARDADGGRDLVLAADRVTAVLGDDADVLGSVAAADLAGLHYRRPFDDLPLDDTARRVVVADFVTTDDGSGIVHLAPAFGEIDREIGEREGLPLLNPVDAAAQFTHDVARFSGRFVKDADPDIIDELADAGLLVRVVDYTHSYPHCWRCATPLVYWAKPTWFARTSDRREDLLRENETIGWHPEHIKHGRFGKWLEGNVDWALSRDRFWGTPLPIWRCVDHGHDTCIGSIAELAEHSGRDLDGMDLHRPTIDEITIPCPECGSVAHRVEPVLDAWFDSGSMPAAQLHYPFENTELFDQRFPADFICEAIDQTRGWFYSLLAVNTLVFERSPYRDVVCLAHILDRDGLKMSKSRGNVVDPWSVLDTRGADALRWFFFASGSPWTSRRFDVQMIDETARRFLGTLWSTYYFFTTYANLDGWEPEIAAGSGDEPNLGEPILDKWIRSRMQSTVEETTDALERFDALRASQAVERFVDDLSNWYVRVSRPRFWKSSDRFAHATLHHCLRTVSLLLAPMCPFTADELWTNLALTSESVHLADWPASDPAVIDRDLETAMTTTRQVVALGRAARAEAKIKVRQPLPRALVRLPSGADIPQDLVAVVATELNVKVIELVTDMRGVLEYAVVPNFRTLGPRVGPLMPQVKAALAEVDGATVQAALDRDGAYDLDVGGESVALSSEDVEVRARAHEHLVLAEESGVAVALDTTVDDALRGEGVARELVRALNDHRKAIDLALADRISADLYVEDAVAAAADRHRDLIAGEVLAVRLTIHPRSEAPDGAPVLDIGDDEIPVVVEVVG